MIHGEAKKKTTPSPEEAARAQELSQRVTLALQHFLQLRQGRASVASPLEATTGLLKLCPEIPTIYNYRMELLLALKKEVAPAEYQQLLASNIQLTTKLLRDNPKSYTIWNYRQALVLQHEGEALAACVNS
jgi:geranylgeranyl transferase type-2 subunit alpha